MNEDFKEAQEDQLGLLSKTIADHAREMAFKEWQSEHRPMLVSILENAGLDLDQGILTLSDREVPVKVIVSAIAEEFLRRRTERLRQGTASKLVRDAMRIVTDE